MTKSNTFRPEQFVFGGQILSQEVFIFKVRHEIRPHIPMSRICHLCYRNGPRKRFMQKYSQMSILRRK